MAHFAGDENPGCHQVSKITAQQFWSSYHRQAVTIPAKPPIHMETALVSEPCDNILDSASENVAIMWETGSKGRSIVESVPATINTHTVS